MECKTEHLYYMRFKYLNFSVRLETVFMQLFFSMSIDFWVNLLHSLLLGRLAAVLKAYLLTAVLQRSWNFEPGIVWKQFCCSFKIDG